MTWISCSLPKMARIYCRIGTRRSRPVRLISGTRTIPMSHFVKVLGWAALMTAVGIGILFSTAARSDDKPVEGSKELLNELRPYPHKIVYETNRDGNWELYLVNADGSNPVNLTRTPDVNELYPKPSPDGTRICFVADEGKGKDKVR